MSSFKQLTKDGVLKRADAHKALYADIVVEPGFNTREDGERLDAHVQAIFEYIMAGGQLPALEVVPTADGKVVVRDGHCRYRAYGMAIEAGAPIEWVDVKQFHGNDVDQVARIVTSNEGLKLTPLETARVYKRLRGFGLKPDDIAAKVGKTRQHVDQLLILADAPHKVQQMVADGTVSATEAIKLARAHGDDAAKVLGNAAAGTKGKVTAKQLKPWTPPPTVVAPLVNNVESLVGSLDKTARTTLTKLANGAAGFDRSATIEVPAGELLDLLNAHAEIEAARKAAEEKQRAKAGKAAQGELVEGGA